MKKTVVAIVGLILSVGSISFAQGEGDNIKNCPFAIAAGLHDDTKESYSSIGVQGTGQGLGSGRTKKSGKIGG